MIQNLLTTQVKIKIHGTPWGYVNEPESIAARATIAAVIENMQKINMRLLINFNTKVRDTDRSTRLLISVIVQ